MFVSAVQSLSKRLWRNTGITVHIVTVKTFSPTGAKVCCRASLAQRPTRSGRTLRLSSTVNYPASTIKLRRKKQIRTAQEGFKFTRRNHYVHSHRSGDTFCETVCVITCSKKKEEAHTVCVGKQ